jgi:hypothetical protein
MPSPFPGMDPYLEDNENWPGFHQFLATQIAITLNKQLGSKYYTDLEVRMALPEVNISSRHPIRPDAGVFERVEAQHRLQTEMATPMRTMVVDIPEAPIHRTVPFPDPTKLRTVKVFRTDTGELVTAVEILSPYNKRRREGLEDYRQKRARLLNSPVHFVEIDFLRGGQRPGSEVNEPPLNTDYVLLVNRDKDWGQRVSEIWPIALSDALPVLPIPLLDPDPDVPLDLGIVLRDVYENGAYERRIDYRKPVPPPKLRPEMAEWLKQHLPQVVD